MSDNKHSAFSRAYLAVRCVFLWIISGVHFFTVCTLLVVLGIFADPRKNDWPQRFFFRNILRLAGVKFEVRFAPRFDRKRTTIFICNHVNIFDAFVIYSAIPQFVRGLELDTHFKVPAYGWMMKRFGNIPVSRKNTPSEFKKLMKRTKAALDDGISLIAFAEGSRTLDGRVQPFKKGIFILAQKYGYPIAPMSIVGSYQFHRKGSWMLYPSKIVVHMHDAIGTEQMGKDDIEPLMKKVHKIVSAPVDASFCREHN